VPARAPPSSESSGVLDRDAFPCVTLDASETIGEEAVVRFKTVLAKLK
jgi:hypothetical protein